MLFSSTLPPAPINGTEPCVSPPMVRFVAVALVALKRVIVPDAAVRSEIFAVETVVVARLEVPVTTKVLVVVAFVVVRLVMKAVVAARRLEKKLVDVEKSKKERTA